MCVHVSSGGCRQRFGSIIPSKKPQMAPEKKGAMGGRIIDSEAEPRDRTLRARDLAPAVAPPEARQSTTAVADLAHLNRHRRCLRATAAVVTEPRAESTLRRVDPLGRTPCTSPRHSSWCNRHWRSRPRTRARARSLDSLGTSVDSPLRMRMTVCSPHPTHSRTETARRSWVPAQGPLRSR